jgi:hypothetical protein
MNHSISSSLTRIVVTFLMVAFAMQVADAQPARLFAANAHHERRALADRLAQQVAREQITGSSDEGNDPKKDLLVLSPALSENDFSVESRRLLEMTFRNDPTKESLLLADLAGVELLDTETAEYAAGPIEQPASGMFYGTLGWAANLVRARRGEHESLRKVLTAARGADMHLQVTTLLAELAYVPQPEVAEYIATIALSEGRLEPVEPTVDGLLYAQYAAAALSRMLKGCPVPYKEDYSYSQDEIQLLREWLRGRDWQFRTVAAPKDLSPARR